MQALLPLPSLNMYGNKKAQPSRKILT